MSTNLTVRDLATNMKGRRSGTGGYTVISGEQCVASEARVPPDVAVATLRFSTAEAAKILDLRLATLKTRLARAWLPIADLEEGRRRVWTTDDLLRAKLTEELSRRGVQFPHAREVVSACAPTWFGEMALLAVALDADGVPGACKLGSVPCIDAFLSNARFTSSVVVSVNVIANWLRERLGVFLTAGADVQSDRIEFQVIVWGKANGQA